MSFLKISRKKQGSKAFKRALTERDCLTNKAVNDFFKEHSDVKDVVCEKLKNVKHKSKFSKKFNNKLKEMTNICFSVFSASTYLDIILDKIVIIDDETIDNVQSSLKQIRNLHWLITKESVKFEVLDTKLSLIPHLKEMTKTFYDMFKYSAIIFSSPQHVK